MASDLKIAVYAIAKDEEWNVDQFTKSCKLADMVVLCDTGSSDSTYGLAMACGAITHRICVRPWRFDVARNAALSLVPSWIDVCVSLDLDEVLEEGWREEIERLWAEGANLIRCRHAFAEGREFLASRVHSRFGFIWKHPCHEHIYPYGGTIVKAAETKRLLISHLPDKNKSRGSYLESLRSATLEDRSSERMAYYHGRELFYRGLKREAVAELQRYLAMNGKFRQERASAMIMIAKCSPGNKSHLLTLAAIEDPESRGPMYELALDAYHRKDWGECYYAACKAIEIKDRPLTGFEPAEAWGHGPHDLAAISAYQLGFFRSAALHGETAAIKSPGDARLEKNLATYKKACA